MTKDTTTQQPNRLIDSKPITVKIASVYAFVFPGFFTLYGGVKIVLSFLDHNYDDLAQPILFLALGLVLLIPAFAFKEFKRWGYWGLVVINAAVVVLAAIGYQQFENIVVLVMSGIALYMLFAPSTTEWLAKHR